MKIALELNEQDYGRLKVEAQRRGVAPEELAGKFVHDQLPGDKLTDAQTQRGLQALKRLAALGKTLPQTDIDPYLEASRRDLEERSERWLRSSTETS